MPSPLYWRFKTDRNYYVYDTYSNQILTVGVHTWQSLDTLLTPAGESASAMHSERAVAGHQAAVEEVAAARAQGYLQPISVARMIFADDDNTADRQMETALPQLTLEVTERCTSRCHYCAYSQDARRCSAPRDMDFDTAISAVAYFMAHSQEARDRTISFWGGEPLLAFRLIAAICDHVEQRYRCQPVRYSFTTNASPITREIGKWLEARAVHLLVSLDGPQVIHDRHRVTKTGAGTFAATIEGLRQLEKTCPQYYESKVWFICTITPRADLHAIQEFYSSEPLVAGHRVMFSLVSGRGTNFFREHGGYSTRELDELQECMVQAVTCTGREGATRPFFDMCMERLSKVARRARTTVGDHMHANGCCVPFTKKLHVAVDGSCHLCERIGHDSPLGNVRTGGIDYRAVRSLMREYCAMSLSECRSCWAFRLCGLCFRDCLHGGALSTADRASRCNRMRDITAAHLRAYARVLEACPEAFEKVVVFAPA